MILEPSVYLVCKEYLDLLHKICNGTHIGNLLYEFENTDIGKRTYLKLTYREIVEFLKTENTYKRRRLRILFPFPRNAPEVLLQEETWVSYLNVMLDLVKQCDALFVTGCDWDEYDLSVYKNRDIISLILGMLRFKGISLSKLVWLYGNVKTAITIEKNLLPNEKPILLYHSWFFRRWKYAYNEFNEHHLDLQFGFTNTVYDKKFLLLNRRIKPHRTAITLWIYDNALQNHFHLSFIKNSEEITDISNEFPRTKKIYPSLEKEKFDKFINSPPLLLDGINQDTIYHDTLPMTYWMSSLVYIITETHYFDHECSEGWVTEKTLKAFLSNIMFIMIGKYKTLEYLKYIGFKTCDFFIDESYDQIKCDEKRMAAIFKEVKRISNIDMPDLLEIKMKNYHDVLYHNKKVLSTLINQDVLEMIDCLELHNMLYR